MKQTILILLLVGLTGGMAQSGSAQGTAFLYQGRLNDGGNPATGSYDLRFTLYNALTNGNQVSLPQTNFAVSVSGGGFMQQLDFGNTFSGTNYWLGIAVRTNGSVGAFTALWPRQPVLPVPYAVFANSASNLLGAVPAAQLSGTVSSAQLAGTYSSPVNFANSGNTLAGTFSGNGAALTNLNASALASGTVADARLSSNVALRNTNQTFTGSNLFTGVNTFTNWTNTFAGTFSGNGAALTNLNATALASGTVADARLSSNVALRNTNQVFTGSNFFSGINTFTNSINTFVGTHIGNGAALTNLNASALASGTVADARLSSNVALRNTNQTFTGSNVFLGVNSFTNRTNTFVGTFTGNGGALTNLNASALAFGTVADERLSTNAALLDANQTFTGSNIFTGTNTFTAKNTFTASNTFNGVNTFTNWGNTFIGNFSGNGLVQWVPVSANAVQAERDRGYMLLSAALTTVTLPLSVNMQLGDIVRISGAGSGGWLATENSGQAIFGNLASYRNSSLAAVPKSGDYYDVAASADGTQMFAVGIGVVGVSASSDSGRTWSSVGGLSGSWYSIACSANGKIVYTVPTGSGGSIWKSTNSGLTWANVGAAISGNSIACAADGSTPVNDNSTFSGNGVCRGRLNTSSIQVSTNSGLNWFNITGPVASLKCLAVSSDCTRLVAGAEGSLLYASANRGATWTPVTTTNQVWSGAWMSPDGSKFAGTVKTSGSVPGGVYNYGVSAQLNTISTNSTISGSQGSAVELQFIGNNQFMPVSSSGIIWAN